MTDFSKTQFYCSRIGQIMTDPPGKTPLQNWQDACKLLGEEMEKYSAMPDKNMKSAQNKWAKIEQVRAKIQELELTKDNELLSDGCKSYLTNLYGWNKYKKWSAATGEGNNSGKKGVMVEDDSILLINQLDGKSYKKNTELMKNDFLIGIPDVITDDYVIDVKSSWNMDTFIVGLTKELPDKYFWQIQGYMSLTGASKGEISYCLISTPEALILNEIEKSKANGKEWTAEEIRTNLTFDDIPIEERRIKIVVERDDDAIARFQKRMVACREYLAEVEGLHFSMR